APARRRRRLAGRAGAAGSRLAVHDAGVYSYIRGATEEGVSPGASPRVRDMKQLHSTTILCVRRDSPVALGGDGQGTTGDTVSKLPARDIVQRSLEIAAEICVYTNTHITILEL